MPNSIARRQLETIDEQWKANHLEAMDCRRLEELLLLCVETFDRINREEEEERLAVLTNKEPPPASGMQEYRDFFSEWATLCKNFLKPLDRLEKRGFVVDYSERFRVCIREAEGILMSDSDFFSGNTLVRLRDEAIEEFRQGEAKDVEGPA